jgi:hypothetical protein
VDGGRWGVSGGRWTVDGEMPETLRTVHDFFTVHRPPSTVHESRDCSGYSAGGERAILRGRAASNEETGCRGPKSWNSGPRMSPVGIGGRRRFLRSRCRRASHWCSQSPFFPERGRNGGEPCSGLPARQGWRLGAGAPQRRHLLAPSPTTWDSSPRTPATAWRLDPGSDNTVRRRPGHAWSVPSAFSPSHASPGVSRP